ncbi:uncharacterized protein ISCGN_001696 [Ixodes scapularis]
MEYRKGADNTVANALSRQPVKDTENGTKFPEEVVSIVCASLNQRDFQDATARDPILPKVMEYISSTWPAEYKLPPGFKPYFAVREQLSQVDGLLFNAEKIVVPTSLRDQVIEIAHGTHQGITRTTSLIKELYWWPQVSLHIKQYVQHCTVCQSTDKSAKTFQAPLQPVGFPSRPWTKLGMDIVGPFECAPRNERFFVTLVDYHSKWPEVMSVHNVKTASVIDFLKSVFAREGLPEEIVTDNGPQFISREFTEFLKNQAVPLRSAPHARIAVPPVRDAAGIKESVVTTVASPQRTPSGSPYCSCHGDAQHGRHRRWGAAHHHDRGPDHQGTICSLAVSEALPVKAVKCALRSLLRSHGRP